MVLGPDDETPPRPRRPVVPGEEFLAELHLVFIELERDSGRAADRIPALETADRADVMSLYRRRIQATRDRLTDLLETWPQL